MYNNCMDKEDAWKHLGKLKMDLISSGYPVNIINNYILEGIKNKKDEREQMDQNFNFYTFLF